MDRFISLLGLTGTAADIASHAILALGTVLLAVAAYYLCLRIFVPLIVKLTKKTGVVWDDYIFNARTLRAACRIVPAVVVWWLMPHVFSRFPAVEEVLGRLLAIYITVMSLLLVLAVINSFNLFEGEKRSATQQYFRTFCGVLKIVAVCVSGIIIVAIAINRSPTTLLTGLGATSAILMLVFKDTITGLVAGIRLTSNDMLRKGDWITVPKANINGIVKDITLTTVKVQNFDNTIITITPQTLVDDSFQNWKGMQEGDGRRVRRTIYIDVHTVRMADDTLKRAIAEKGLMKSDDMRGEVVNLTLFRRYTERWLARRDDVNEEMFIMTRQMEGTPTGLPVEIYFFLREKAWKPYEEHLAETMEHIYATLPSFGLRVYQRESDANNGQ